MKHPAESSSVIDRVLHALTSVARAGRPIGAKQIAADIGAPLSTVYRLLGSLKQWGLLQEHANSGLFEPGPSSVQLAWGFDQNAQLVTQSRDEIQALVQRTGESVGLLVPINDAVVCLSMIESDQPLRCSFARGRAHPLTRGASAKALLAFLPEAKADVLIAGSAPDDAESAAALRVQLEEIRRRRFATSESEVDIGVWGVSAPLISDAGRLEGTITLMAPVARIAGREAELAQLTRAAADRIGYKL
ncbi:IclR family transcriptional regulator [Caballeronia sp. dw_19]|jgi:DNA-binding IclR family transcriptional regulator|uniref:IclR family transcriptional regulator n=1 Tax=unclassified Caballeronia TaxID=2646786 RepID=UPI001BCF3211|nr:IclR family transcriptional regulator [Caballeronia sp. dw_19]